MDHLIIVEHENDLIKHLMEPRERETGGILGRRQRNRAVFDHDHCSECIQWQTSSSYRAVITGCFYSKLENYLTFEMLVT